MACCCRVGRTWWAEIASFYAWARKVQGQWALGRPSFGLMRDFCSLSAMSLPLGQIKMIVILYGLS